MSSTSEIARLREELAQEKSKREDAEAALQRAQTRLRTVIDSLPFQVFVIGVDGRYSMQNELLSNTWGDLVGKRPADLAPNPESLAVWEANNARAFSGEVVREETSYELAGETVHVHNIIAPVYEDGEVTAILGVNIDIGDRKRAEEERTVLESHLRHADKMEAIGTLAGGIAHDFNNLLMAIQGNISLLRLDVSAAHAHRASLDEVERVVQSGARLTSQLLGYARKGRFEPRPTDVNSLITEVASTLQRTKRHITVATDLAARSAVVADRGQIEQVLMNLLINAADAMPNGGVATVTARDVTASEPDQLGLTPGPYVEIVVRDEGEGMDRATRDRVFEPFFTTKEMGRGTGLGLASVYGIVTAHAGHVRVDSEPGHGAAFTLLLRASDQACEEVRPERAEPLEAEGAVLIVDDEPAVLKVGAAMLQRIGFEVRTAGSGEDALEIVRSGADEFRLVVLDMIMPTMGGAAVFDELQALRPDIKVLLASGYSIDDGARELLSRGCGGFIQKPFRLQDLSNAIGDVLAD